MSSFKEAEEKLGIANTPDAPVAGDLGRNIAVRVMAYDKEAKTTTGVDLATGETVTIRLRELAKPNPARLDIDEWSKDRFKVKNNITSIANPKAVVAGQENGGVIIFEGVLKDRDGALTARWGTVASHTLDEADVFVALMRPATKFGKGATEIDDKRSIEIVRPLSARPIKDTTELYAEIGEILQRRGNQAVVRARDGEGELRVANVWRAWDREKNEGRPVAEAVERFKTQDKALGRILTDEICANPAITVEVMALERIYPGRDYKQTLTDDSKLEARRLQRDWSLGEGKGFGFGQAIVALRTHEEGGQMFTMIRPTAGKMVLWPTLADIPTPNITPAATPVVRATADAGADTDSALADAAGNLTEEQAGINQKLATAQRALAR